MAAKTAETKKKNKTIVKPKCPSCGADKQVIQYVACARGHYPDKLPKRGFFWTCLNASCAWEERVQ